MSGQLQNLPLTTKMHNAHQSLVNSIGVSDIEMAESAMEQCHCCKQWFLQIEGHYAKEQWHLFSSATHGWSNQEIMDRKDRETSGKQ
jgi:hypothetical protein